MSTRDFIDQYDDAIMEGREQLNAIRLRNWDDAQLDPNFLKERAKFYLALGLPVEPLPSPQPYVRLVYPEEEYGSIA